jgi:hypothetical protein
VRLITWNVNRRVSLLAGQAAALASREPDVVALQEVTVRSWPLWRAALETIGLPHAANGWIKPDTLAALRAGLEAGSGPRVLCGDLNTPRRESPDGSVISFARHARAPARGARHALGRRRAGHRPPPRRARLRRRVPDGPRLRVEGAELGLAPRRRLAPRPRFVIGLAVIDAVYHHGWRDDGLSDHSALEADLRPQRPRSR